VDDEGVPGGALLGGEDRGYGVLIQCVGSEAIDGFSGEGDEATVAEEVCGVGDVIGLGGVEVKGFHQRPSFGGFFIVANCHIFRRSVPTILTPCTVPRSS